MLENINNYILKDRSNVIESNIPKKSEDLLGNTRYDDIEMEGVYIPKRKNLTLLNNTEYDNMTNESLTVFRPSFQENKLISNELFVHLPIGITNEALRALSLRNLKL